MRRDSVNLILEGLNRVHNSAVSICEGYGSLDEIIKEFGKDVIIIPNNKDSEEMKSNVDGYYQRDDVSVKMVSYLITSNVLLSDVKALRRGYSIPKAIFFRTNSIEGLEDVKSNVKGISVSGRVKDVLTYPDTASCEGYEYVAAAFSENNPDFKGLALDVISHTGYSLKNIVSTDASDNNRKSDDIIKLLNDYTCPISGYLIDAWSVYPEQYNSWGPSKVGINVSRWLEDSIERYTKKFNISEKDIIPRDLCKDDILNQILCNSYDALSATGVVTVVDGKFSSAMKDLDKSAFTLNKLSTRCFTQRGFIPIKGLKIVTRGYRFVGDGLKVSKKMCQFRAYIDYAIFKICAISSYEKHGKIV